MLESAVRANMQRLYGMYHSMPYPVQNLLTSARGLLLARHRYAESTMRYLQQLRTHERWTWSEIVEYQCGRLQWIIQQARTRVPFYADYPAITVESLADLRRLPVLRRETVRGNPQLFVARD